MGPSPTLPRLLHAYFPTLTPLPDLRDLGDRLFTAAKSRKMPPPGMGAAPTACQMAALEAWLALPKVTQMHRADDSSPTTPYAMPPYN